MNKQRLVTLLGGVIIGEGLLTIPETQGFVNIFIGASIFIISIDYGGK